MKEYWQRACEVVRDSFGQRFVYALATSAEGQVNVRSVYSFMYNDKMYIITHSDSNKVKEIEKNPQVAMVYKAQRAYGIATNLGHPLLEQNKELSKIIRREMGDAYQQVVTESDENVCILEISVYRAVAYTAIHKYDINFRDDTLLRERHYGQVPELNFTTML